MSQKMKTGFWKVRRAWSKRKRNNCRHSEPRVTLAQRQLQGPCTTLVFVWAFRGRRSLRPCAESQPTFLDAATQFPMKVILTFSSKLCPTFLFLLDSEHEVWVQAVILLSVSDSATGEKSYFSSKVNKFQVCLKKRMKNLLL